MNSVIVLAHIVCLSGEGSVKSQKLCLGQNKLFAMCRMSQKRGLSGFDQDNSEDIANLGNQ